MTRGKNKNRKRHRPGDQTENGRVDPVRAIVACRPRAPGRNESSDSFMQSAIALHSSIRFVCMRDDSIALIKSLEVQAGDGTGGTEGSNGNVIRAMQFSPDGKHLAVAGDDKALYVYDVDDDFKLVCRSMSPKKLSCVTWMDNTGVLVANKYGDVTVVDIRQGGRERELLGHFCSVVLSLCACDVKSPELADTVALLSSADRDGKVRVTAVDVDKLHVKDHNNEIQSFCLGHTSYVSSGVFVGTGKPILVTGGGDGVRVWDPMNGRAFTDHVWSNVKVLQLVGLKNENCSGVVAIFDGNEKPEAGLLSIQDVTKGDALGIQCRTYEVSGMSKVSGVDVDQSSNIVWFVGAGEDGKVAVKLMKVGDLEFHELHTDVADDVFSNLSEWTVPDSFFASYYNKTDAGVINDG